MAHKRHHKGSSTGRKSPKSTKTAKPATAGTSKMTMCTVPLVAPRSPIRERRTDRRVTSGKRLAMVRAFPGKIRAVTRRSLDPCDNSNDSGLGFDNHVDHHASITERLAWTNDRAEAKRPRLDIKLEDDEVNDNFSFPETIRTCKDTMSIIRTAPSGTAPTLSIHGTQSSSGSRAVPRCTPLSSRSSPSQPITLTSQLSNISREADVSLRIVQQPEQQHRARYQTEGSRGAVKDRSGNGFPVVQLTGYSKPATLQVFIGTDVGKVTPHMFYQACRVSGKNSTPCVEKKLDGTVVIELQLDPTKDMTGVCDCVGILKERNVDVEHRFPDQIGSRSKKKSTRCRMVFRTTIAHENGIHETLQVCSQPIVCTQPPGIPEICKKSLTSCPASGGLELFILGKNFLKDTKVYFQQADEQGRWEQFVIPDKEFLQQTHLVCVIPPYARSDITEPVTVRLLVVSSGKTSEPHQFVYTPTSGAVSSVRVESAQPATFMNKAIWSSVNKHEQGIMPPPGTNHMPLSQRRSSVNVTSPEVHSPPLHSLKQELVDENSQNSIIDPLELHRERFRNISESSLDVQQGDSNMAMINESSMDMLRHSSVSLDGINHNMNENSMNSLNENSVELMVRRNSGGSQSLHGNSLTSLNENSMEMMVRRNSGGSQSLHRNSLTSLNENSMQMMVRRNSGGSQSLHGNSLTSLNENSMEMMVRRNSAGSQSLHRNSMNTINESSIELMVRRNSGGSQSLHETPMDMPLANAALALSESNTIMVSNAQIPATIVTEDLNVMDLRMKMPAATVADLANTNAPSLATLQSFCITEPTNLPLPAQTAQSIENYLSTIETKPVNVDAMTLPTNGALHLTQMLNTSQQSTMLSQKVLTSQVMPAQTLLATTTTQSLSHLGAIQTQLGVTGPASSFNPSQPPLLPAAAMRTTPELVPPNGLIAETAVSSIQSAIEGGILSSKPLSVENHISTDRNVHSPQDILIGNKSPLLPSASAQDVLMNTPTQLIPPTITTSLASPNLEQTEVNVSAQTVPNISPEVILNSQISPSMMCRSTSALSQEGLLTICQPNVATDSNLIQPQITLSETVSQQSPLAPLLSAESSPSSLTPTRPPVLPNQLSSIINTTEPEKAILFKATVDLLETQKKISQLETLSVGTTPNSMEQVIINDILSTSPSREPVTQLPNAGNNLQQTTLTTNLIVSREGGNVAPPNGIKDVTSQISEKKNEDRMIPSGFATMSENELISIINPSCFDQGNNFH